MLLHTQIHVFLAVFALASCFLPNIFPLVLFKSFAVHIALGLYFVSFIYLLIKRLRIFLMYFFVATLIFFNISSFIFRNNHSDSSVVIDFTLAHFNVFYLNKNYEQMTNIILESEADMVSLQEVDKKWAQALENALPKKYPHYQIRVDGKNSGGGMAIFSKIPFVQLDSLRFDDLPYFFGKVKIKDQILSFFVAHTYSPSNFVYYVRRNRQFSAIRDFLSKKESPLVFIGDLNAVGWDNEVLQTEKRLFLQDSRRGFKATFPAFAQNFGIPIDYIFHSPQIICLDFKTIKTNSDHLGILGKYYFKNP